jgi:hypothetical protein
MNCASPVEVAADLRASPQISTEFTSASTRRRRLPDRGTARGAVASLTGLARGAVWRRPRLCRLFTWSSTALVGLGSRPPAPPEAANRQRLCRASWRPRRVSYGSSSGGLLWDLPRRGRGAAAAPSGLARLSLAALSRLHEVQHSVCRRAAPDSARAGPRGVLVGSCTGRRLCNCP